MIRLQLNSTENLSRWTTVPQVIVMNKTGSFEHQSRRNTQNEAQKPAVASSSIYRQGSRFRIWCSVSRTNISIFVPLQVTWQKFMSPGGLKTYTRWDTTSQLRKYSSWKANTITDRIKVICVIEHVRLNLSPNENSVTFQFIQRAGSRFVIFKQTERMDLGARITNINTISQIVDIFCSQGQDDHHGKVFQACPI